MWYGWQILIPAVVADALVVGGFFAGFEASSWGLWITGASIHVLSGPIVHFANGQPIKAAISFLVEGALPGGVGAATAAMLSSCRGDCTGGIVFLFGLLPASWVVGTVVDMAVLAKKEVKPKPEKGPAISLAPLVLPKVHPNSSTPAGLSLVGQF